MITLAESINALGVADYVIDGDPTNETEFNLCFKKVIGVDDNDTAILSDDQSLFGVTWDEVIAKKTELEAAEPMRLLRAERNQRLAETDWWASSDLTMTAEQTAYRQALRDITNSYSSLDTVVWPTKPE